MKSLLQQLKKRRIALGLKQSDMMLRVGVSRQQYQHLESKGNPRLETLELIAKGLNSEVMLIPKEKLTAVIAVLEGTAFDGKGLSIAENAPYTLANKEQKSLLEDPWQGTWDQDLQGDK